MQLRLLDLFSGIGGFSLGLERSGLCKTEAFVEIDPHARKVLRRHWPDVPVHDDITTREFHEGEADVICGGFPCQDVSCAGKRAGIAGKRSGLYRELVRAVRVVRPQFALLENVAALLNDGMGTVLGDLAESGDCVEWDCVPAAVVGAPHERDRVWIVVHVADPYSLNGRDRARDEKDGQETGDGAAPSPVARDASDIAREQVGPTGQPRFDGGTEPSSTPYAPDPHRERWGEARGLQHRSNEVLAGRTSTPSHSNAASDGCGQGRTRRPPDSFARIRDEARRNAADPYSARLAFREGITRDAWEKLTPAERDAFGNERQSIWPDEPALQGVDDVTPHWMDRVRETGNAVVSLIPQLIGEGIKAQLTPAQP